MMNVRKIYAVLWKQVIDTLKNKAVLIQFVMFPILALIMEKTVTVEGLSENYFMLLFATMYVGMAPLASITAIISEEKEKQTLKVLIMSNVKAGEYLIGVGTYVTLACMVGAVIFGFTGGYTGIKLLAFLIIMLAGIIVSAMIGAVIGVWSKNQMSATSLMVPVMLVFAFLPMIAMFNESIRVVSRFTYSQQINYLIHQINALEVKTENVLIIALNMIVITALFVLAYRRSRLI